MMKAMVSMTNAGIKVHVPSAIRSAFLKGLSAGPTVEALRKDGKF